MSQLTRRDLLKLGGTGIAAGLGAPDLVTAQAKDVTMLDRGMKTALDERLRGADRVSVIDHGTIVFADTPDALRADAQTTATYLGVGGSRA